MLPSTTISLHGRDNTTLWPRLAFVSVAPMTRPRLEDLESRYFFATTSAVEVADETRDLPAPPPVPQLVFTAQPARAAGAASLLDAATLPLADSVNEIDQNRSVLETVSRFTPQGSVETPGRADAEALLDVTLTAEAGERRCSGDDNEASAQWTRASEPVEKKPADGR